MDRPKGVDKSAKWFNNEWHLGTLTKKGPKGRYTVWMDSGILIHDGEFSNRGQILWFKSLYPNGVVGKDVKYDADTNQTTVTYRSSDKLYSWLLTPLPLSDKGYAIKIYNGKLPFNHEELNNGSADGVTFFTEHGEQLNTFNTQAYTDLIEKYSLEPAHESWQQALNRLTSYWEELKKLLLKDRVSEYTDYFTPNFIKGISKTDIDKAEQRLGVVLPASYKQFILDQGLISFGEDIQDPMFGQRMLHPRELNTIEYFFDPEKTADFDEYFSLSTDLRSQLICFFEDEPDRQYNGWIAFDCSTNKENEYPVISDIGYYTISEWENEVGKEIVDKGSSMDRFISTYVNTLIRNRES